MKMATKFQSYRIISHGCERTNWRRNSKWIRLLTLCAWHIFFCCRCCCYFFSSIHSVLSCIFLRVQCSPMYVNFPLPLISSRRGWLQRPNQNKKKRRKVHRMECAMREPRILLSHVLNGYLCSDCSLCDKQTMNTIKYEHVRKKKNEINLALANPAQCSHDKSKSEATMSIVP